MTKTNSKCPTHDLPGKHRKVKYHFFKGNWIAVFRGFKLMELIATAVFQVEKKQTSKKKGIINLAIYVMNKSGYTFIYIYIASDCKIE